MRVTNQLFPHGFVIPMSTEMTITQWHVPVDDENCYWYAIFTSYTAPVDKKKMRDQRLELYELPDYTSRKNKTQRLRLRSARAGDRDLYRHGHRHQRPRPVGGGIDGRDPGPHQRASRHLATRRSCSIAACCGRRSKRLSAARSRCMFLDDAHARSIQGPATMDGIGPTRGWEIYWMEVDVKRRRGAPWAAPVPSEIAGQDPASVGGGVMASPSLPRTVIAQERSRSNPCQRWRTMDCFAALAMTADIAPFQHFKSDLQESRVEFRRTSRAVVERAAGGGEPPAQHRRGAEARSHPAVVPRPARHSARQDAGRERSAGLAGKRLLHHHHDAGQGHLAPTVFPVFTAGGGFGMKEMEGAADVLMVADPTTFRVLPWAPTTGWLLCDLYFSDGRPVPFATRHLYRAVLDKLGTARLRFRRGARGRIPPLQARRRAHGAGGCRPARPAAFGQPAVARLSISDRAALRPDGAGAGNHPPRRAGARPAACARSRSSSARASANSPSRRRGARRPPTTWCCSARAVKQIARRHGYHATFMCRPKLPNVFASGWHLHQSLVSRASGENAFMAEDGGEALSPVRPRLSRRPAGARARVDRVHDADHQRLQALPLLFAGAGPRDLGPRQPRRHDPRARRRRTIAATRLENRIGEPAANPYLYMASQILSGLDGVDRKLDPGPSADTPYETKAALLPKSLREAVFALQRRSVLPRARSARSSSTTTSTSRTPRSSASRPRCRTGSTANISRCFEGWRSLVVPAWCAIAHLAQGPITTNVCGYNRSSNSVLISIDHAVMVWTAPYGISVPE